MPKRKKFWEIKPLPAWNTKTMYPEKSKISADGIFVEIGIVPNTDLVKDIVSLNLRGRW